VFGELAGRCLVWFQLVGVLGVSSRPLGPVQEEWSPSINLLSSAASNPSRYSDSLCPLFGRRSFVSVCSMSVVVLVVFLPHNVEYWV
jgi:hypothetical protein